MATKIKYVQLEPAEVLLDFHTSRMTAEQFGCYWLMIMSLYCQNGKLEFDVKELGLLCNCTKNFEKVWEKIGTKFQKNKNFIKQKRVTSELRRAKRFIQHQRKAGLASARARQPRFNHASTEAQPSKGNEREVKLREDKLNEVKENEVKQTQEQSTEKDLADTRTQEGQEIQQGDFKQAQQKRTSGNSVFSSALTSISSRSNSVPGGLLSKQLQFNEQLKEIIRPQSPSDLTCFRNIGNWLMVKIHAGVFNEQIILRVLEYAAEAVKGRSRNPAAVFISILKKELGYKPG